MAFKRTALEETLAASPLLVLDGSMSTPLENMGVGLNTKLWTARALADCLEKIKQVHKNYLKAGADCGITCSYQATIPGLMGIGYTKEQAEELIVKSVGIFQEAREEWWQEEGKDGKRVWPLCLASVGPYGAYLADGSEYRGNYGVSEETLYEFHKHRMELLWEAGADLLLMETQPSLKEALTEAKIAEEIGADYWISFSCMDEKHINEGEKIAECAKIFSQDAYKYPHLKMLGANCTKPVYISRLIRELRAGTDLPIAVYPNSGEEYDPITKTWHGTNDKRTFYDYALSYFQNGATAVGGCCTTVESHIRQAAEARRDFEKMENAENRKIPLAIS